MRDAQIDRGISVQRAICDTESNAISPQRPSQRLLLAGVE